MILHESTWITVKLGGQVVLQKRFTSTHGGLASVSFGLRIVSAIVNYLHSLA